MSQATRLDRLLLLLDTGTASATRKAAAEQIGELSEGGSDGQVQGLLTKVRAMLRSKTWEPSTLDPLPSTLNPQPSPLNPQPSTLTPQPSTLNPQPSTLNPQPSTLNPQPSTLNPQPSTLIPEP